MCSSRRRFNSEHGSLVHNVQSDKVHKDFILHHTGDLGHPGLRYSASLTSRHQDLTCTQGWELGRRVERERNIVIAKRDECCQVLKVKVHPKIKSQSLSSHPQWKYG